MNSSESYVCFALWGAQSGPYADFSPARITERLGITPTRMWTKGTKKALSGMPWPCGGWLWETARGTEPVEIDKLVNQVLDVFETKADDIVALKREFALKSELKIILYVDMNATQPTPSLGHDLRTIRFLHTTQTTTDVDIYRYASQGSRLPATH